MISLLVEVMCLSCGWRRTASWNSWTWPSASPLSSTWCSCLISNSPKYVLTHHKLFNIFLQWSSSLVSTKSKTTVLGLLKSPTLGRSARSRRSLLSWSYGAWFKLKIMNSIILGSTDYLRLLAKSGGWLWDWSRWELFVLYLIFIYLTSSGTKTHKDKATAESKLIRYQVQLGKVLGKRNALQKWSGGVWSLPSELFSVECG